MIDTLTEYEQRTLLMDKEYGFHILHAAGVKKIEWDLTMNKKYQRWLLVERFQMVAPILLVAAILFFMMGAL